jgi:hypothetical protein
MGQVTGERRRVSGREHLGVLAHCEFYLAVQDQEQLEGSRRVRLGGVTLTRPERPVPQPDAERVTDEKQRGDARVSRALLDADQHPAADARALGQLVQGPASASPSLPDPVANRPRDAVRPGASAANTSTIYGTT